MAFPYRRILAPLDFDDNSLLALEAAAQLARQNDGSVILLHVVPMMMPQAGMPFPADPDKTHQAAALAKLHAIAREHLDDVEYELVARLGSPAEWIIDIAREKDADLVVMATHGRRGISHLFLGSVAERVLQGCTTCPVLTVRSIPEDTSKVAAWMTKNPVTATEDEKLSSVRAKMDAGDFRRVPVMREGVVVGIVTESDLLHHAGRLREVEVKQAMSERLVTVSPETSVREAARLLRRRKIGGLPVVTDGSLAGIITITDVLQALSEQD